MSVTSTLNIAAHLCACICAYLARLRAGCHIGQGYDRGCAGAVHRSRRAVVIAVHQSRSGYGYGDLHMVSGFPRSICKISNPSCQTHRLLGYDSKFEDVLPKTTVIFSGQNENQIPGCFNIFPFLTPPQSLVILAGVARLRIVLMEKNGVKHPCNKSTVLATIGERQPFSGQ